MWRADQFACSWLKACRRWWELIFNFFSLQRNRVSPNSIASIGNHSLQIWKDVLVAQTVPATISAPVIFVGNGTKADLDKADVKGKAVAIQASPEGLNLKVSLWERRYPGLVLNKFRKWSHQPRCGSHYFYYRYFCWKSWNQVIPPMSRGLYEYV